MENKLKALFTSRKFYATVLAVASVVVKAYFPNIMSDPQMLALVGSLSAYVLGTGLESSGK